MTRLDLAVTVYDPDPAAARARAAYGQIARSAMDSGRPPSASLIVALDGGETCYIGSRTSERYARIYAKGPESGDPAYRDCWRYELELKSEVATRVARRLATVPRPRRAMAALVHAYLTERGVDVPWSRDEEPIDCTVPRARSDAERRLAWLRTQVAPTVAWLRTAGYGEQALAALGLAPGSPAEPTDDGA